MKHEKIFQGYDSRDENKYVLDSISHFQEGGYSTYSTYVENLNHSDSIQRVYLIKARRHPYTSRTELSLLSSYTDVMYSHFYSKSALTLHPVITDESIRLHCVR